MESLSSTIINILDCRLEKLDNRVLTHYFIKKWAKANKALSYIRCLDQYKARANFDILTSCLPWLKQSCLSSNIRAIKTIRLPGALVEALHVRDPTIQFVYYPRDPRGMIASRADFKLVDLKDMGQVQAQAIKQCSWMRHDIKTLWNKRTSNISIVTLQYESLALSPVANANRLYDYLNITLPESLASWIVQNTESKRDDGLLGTTRNSSKVISKWKSKFSIKSNAIVTHFCADILKQLNYTLVL